MVLDKILESHLDSREIKPVNYKGNQPWILIGRTDAKGEAPILWPPDAQRPIILKDPVSGKGWRQKEKGMTEDEMVEWHHRVNGPEFEQTPGDGETQGNLVWCSPWGPRIRHNWVTEQQQWYLKKRRRRRSTDTCNNTDEFQNICEWDPNKKMQSQWLHM